MSLKICIVHNQYGKSSGEEVVVGNIRRLLQERGNEVIPFFRSSAEIPKGLFGQFQAFFSGIYSFRSREAMRRLLREKRPHIVHVHNLFPLISPSVLEECRRSGIPVVMSVHNYRLICPNGLHLSRGQVCERCAGGREYWCILRNCEGDLFKSTGYALRNYMARKRRSFLDNVALYATLTNFQRQRLIAEGFPAERITVLPNMAGREVCGGDLHPGEYVGYIGRISQEKGLPSLLLAAKRCENTSFKIAGDYRSAPDLLTQAPSNVEFLGYLDGIQLEEFYSSIRIMVFCSVCFEGFPMVLLEAMMRGKPVIASRIGGLPEIVEEGKTGLLFEPGNGEDLADKLRYLWGRPDLCCAMGRAGREKALREYSPEKYYQQLMIIYQEAIRRRSERCPS